MTVAEKRRSADQIDTPLRERCFASRAASCDIARPLSPEDQVVQACDDASPTKWHLAHTTWFYETFVLKPNLTDYHEFDPAFSYLFNSYYEAAGPRHPRPYRGLLTRPPLSSVHDYRAHVDAALARVFERRLPSRWPEIGELIELGIAHEEQHQELMLMDILALFSTNPLHPAYTDSRTQPSGRSADDSSWIEFPGGIHEIGAPSGFAFDCEQPVHTVLVHPYALANRLVTNGEWLEFMADGGYETPALWLSDGWATVKRQEWQAPGYWERSADGQWQQMTLHGLLPVEPAAPVCHVSYYEADAYARWADARLPTEQEWEIASTNASGAANTLGTGHLRPVAAKATRPGELAQMMGDVWEWTQSAYSAYPGYRPATGAVGEYNGKFMCGQYVLRGGSCVTPDGHSRPSYRNFFYPHQRWQFAGLRLATDRGTSWR